MALFTGPGSADPETTALENLDNSVVSRILSTPADANRRERRLLRALTKAHDKLCSESPTLTTHLSLFRAANRVLTRRLEDQDPLHMDLDEALDNLLADYLLRRASADDVLEAQEDSPAKEKAERRLKKADAVNIGGPFRTRSKAIARLRKASKRVDAALAAVTGCDTFLNVAVNTDGFRSGDAVDRQIAVEGGLAPYSFTLLSGELPTGLQMSESGLLSGILEMAGTFAFTVEVIDSNVPPCTLNRLFDDVNVTIGPLRVIPMDLDPVGVGAPVQIQMKAGGGVPPYSFAVVDGNFPLGLTMPPSGLVSGNVQVADTYTFTVRARDSVGNDAEHMFDLVVGP